MDDSFENSVELDVQQEAQLETTAALHRRQAASTAWTPPQPSWKRAARSR